MNDTWSVGGLELKSRLLLGTAKYPSLEVMTSALSESHTELVTVSIRRIDLASASKQDGLIGSIRDNYIILPNTAGCYTAKDAVLTAQLARESLETNLIKLEVIGDDKTLLPDSVELLKAAKTLVADGFIVLPYCTDDPIVCQRLRDAGCAAVMPLGSPIGSGMGILNPYNFQIIRDQIEIPVIVDAGIGTASEAAFAMEIGCDAVLLNSAVSGARNPVLMATAFRDAIAGGRAAFLAGRIPTRNYASNSSPHDGMIETG